MEQGKFVFVVCGGKEHVETLHYSLRALRHFSTHDILVVTDSVRNEIPVQHENIIDVRTPPHFDHHQASIYLKTGLHNILSPGNLYCYLDTDVVALSQQVNDIFNKKAGIITFAIDHCQMHQFSPYAVNCGCLEKNKAEWNTLEEMLNRFDNSEQVTNLHLLKKQRELKRKFELIKRNRLRYAKFASQYLLSGKILHLDENTYFDKEKRIWYDTMGNAILFDLSENTIKQIEQNTNWRWNFVKRRWISPTGNDVHQLDCNHLKQAIAQKFNIQVKGEKWQHWNGGVFLFDDASHNFMQTWHLKTLEIFNDPHWKTRDQGTLIATAWQFGLQNAPVISKHFNFIADFSNPRLMLSEDRGFITDDAFITQYSPAFIHIFHHFGKKGWEIWDWVEAKLQKEIPAMAVGEPKPQ